MPGASGGGGDYTPPSLGGEGPPPPYRSRESTLADPRRGPDPDGETWTPTTTWDSVQTPTHPAAGMDPQADDPWMADRLENPQAEDRPKDWREKDHLVDPRAEGP